MVEEPGKDVKGEPSVSVQSTPYPSPPQSNEQDGSFVVSTNTSANPFIPQTGVPQAEGTVGVPSSGNRGLWRIIMSILILILVGAVIFGIKYLYGRISSSKHVTLTYWGLWEDSATMKTVITDFEASHSNITITYTMQSPRQYRERLQAAIARGNGPDVFRFHNTWVPMLHSELTPAPKEMITPSTFASTFYPVSSADLVGGQYIYGMPVMIDGLGLYYNEDLFASAGVTAPPVTWEDVLSIVPKLTVKNDDIITTSAIALGTAGNVENFSDILAVMMIQNGAKLVTPTGKQAEEALVFYKKFTTPSDPVYTWNESMDNSIYAFASGKVAMILAPSWRTFEIKQINPSLRFKISPIPQLPGNTVTWASYWAEGVSQKSKYQNQAWEFVNYLASRDTQVKLYTEASKTRLFGEPYARVDLASTLTDAPYVGAYILQAQSAQSFPLASRTFDNGINDKLIKYLEDAVNAVGQGEAPSAALDTAANGFQQVLGSYGLTTNSAPPAR